MTTKQQSTTEERPVRCAACGEQMYYEGNVQHEPEIVMTVDFRNGDYSHRNDGGGVFYVHERCFGGFQLRFSDSSVNPASAAPVVDETFDVRWRRPNTSDVLECHDLTAALLVFRIRAAIRMSGSVELLSVEPKEVSVGVSEPSVSNHVFTCSACSRQWTIDSQDALECFFVGLCYWCIRQHKLTKADIESRLRSLLPAAPVEQSGDAKEPANGREWIRKAANELYNSGCGHVMDVSEIETIIGHCWADSAPQAKT